MAPEKPSSQPGMGAIPIANGTAFRVWAPHADRVYVAGTFNDWNAQCDPLYHTGNGYWSANISAAQVGDEYKYVIVNDGQEYFRIDPYAKNVTSSTGNAIIHDDTFDWQDTRYQTPPWHQIIIYEMHIGTFNDQPGGPPGNLDKAIEKLNYLADLGINAIQLMPPMEFAGGFSWGYNPSHIFAIEQDYGGPDALKTFVDAAHKLGIAVLFDVVYNHFGPMDLDLWQFDGWSENNLGGIYFYNDWRAQTPWGHTRPNYGRHAVRQYIRDNALMWLHEYRADGLRWDATAYIRNARGQDNDPAHDIPKGWTLMQWINDEIDRHQPWKMCIAEDLRGNPWITKDTSTGGAGFDAQWNARFVHPIRNAIIPPHDHERNVYAVRDALLYSYGDNRLQRVIYTESHDEVANGQARVPEEIWHGHADSWYAKKRSTLGAVLVFTAPGIPMIFQGQEFLEDEWFHDQDPIDWDKATKYAGILALYRDLIRLRRNLTGSTKGLLGQHIHVHHLNNADKVIAFHRWDRGGPKDDVVVVINLANVSYERYMLGFPRPGTWRVRFNSDWNGYDPSYQNHPSYDTQTDATPKDNMPCTGSVGLGPYSAIILSQEN